MVPSGINRFDNDDKKSRQSINTTDLKKLQSLKLQLKLRERSETT